MQTDSILRGSRQDPEPILGHIGQMLQDDRGIEVFLRAHTGIYFVSSAARQARKSVGEHGVFPDWVFGLFSSRHSDTNCSAAWTKCRDRYYSTRAMAQSTVSNK